MSIISMISEKEPELILIELRVGAQETVYEYSDYIFRTFIDRRYVFDLSSEREAEVVQVDFERRDNDGSWVAVATVSPTTGFQDTTVYVTGKYEYRARVLDTGGIYSEYSNIVTINFTKIAATPPLVSMSVGAGGRFSNTFAPNKELYPTAPAEASIRIFTAAVSGTALLSSSGSSAQAGIAVYLWEILGTPSDYPFELASPNSAQCFINRIANPPITELRYMYVKLTVTDTQGQSGDLTAAIPY